MKDGYGWVVGNGNSIVATKDHWLRDKVNFSVEDWNGYNGRCETVNSLFYPGTKDWNEERIRQMFMVVDVNAILATRVPQHDVEDRIVWSSSKEVIYTAKAGYRYWHDIIIVNSATPLSSGWHRIRRLAFPINSKSLSGDSVVTICPNYNPLSHV